MLRIIFSDFIRVFQPPTPAQMAEEELMHAKRELLRAHSSEEYAHHMANYHAERIERLTNFINQQNQPCQSNPLNSGTNVRDPIPLSKASTSSLDAISKKSWR